MFCFLNYFARFMHRWRGAYVLIATLARWTRWSIRPDTLIMRLRSHLCTPEEKRSFLARRAQETEQRRALFNAETDAETTMLPALYTLSSLRF